MIKIERTPCPTFLSIEKAKELTKKFKETGKSVWKNKKLKKALLEMTNYKCAYCETRLEVKDSYMEVEHFHPKSLYELEVLCWNNLLPSCKTCNGNKRDHDTIKEPIINPCEDDPKRDLCVEGARLYPKLHSAIGKSTIDTLALNDNTRLVTPRFELCNSVKKELEELHYNNIIDCAFRNKFKGLLSACSADTPFSAFTSNTLHNDSYYSEIKEKLKSNNLWSDELDELDKATKNLALDSR